MRCGSASGEVRRASYCYCALPALCPVGSSSGAGARLAAPASLNGLAQRRDVIRQEAARAVRKN